MTTWLRWILAVLSAYRLAALFSKDDGPLFAFARLREYADEQRAIEQGWWERGPWAAFDEMLRCPYCIGVWMAGLCAFLVWRPSRLGDIFLSWLGLAGAQSAVQVWTEKEGYL